MCTLGYTVALSNVYGLTRQDKCYIVSFIQYVHWGLISLYILDLLCPLHVQSNG